MPPDGYTPPYYANTIAADWLWNFSDSSDRSWQSEQVYYPFLGVYLSKEELAQVEHAQACKRRDLGYLYRLPRPARPCIRQHRVLFQPCWSARRWKSVTG